MHSRKRNEKTLPSYVLQNSPRLEQCKKEDATILLSVPEGTSSHNHPYPNLSRVVFL